MRPIIDWIKPNQTVPRDVVESCEAGCYAWDQWWHWNRPFLEREELFCYRCNRVSRQRSQRVLNLKQRLKKKKKKAETFLLVQVNWFFFFTWNIIWCTKKNIIWCSVDLETIKGKSWDWEDFYSVEIQRWRISQQKTLWWGFLVKHLHSQLSSFLCSFFIYFVSLVFQKNI